jgi:hypothetical protein
MLAMVLAIGLLVDDAIVVIENVDRLMRDEGLSPRDATIRSMEQMTGAIIGIGLVLSAVFIPMAFFGGSTGVIYRQFSITMVFSMVISAFVALSLTPALCATVLKPHDGAHEGRGPLAWFNHTFDRETDRYAGAVGWINRRPVRRRITIAPCKPDITVMPRPRSRSSGRACSAASKLCRPGPQEPGLIPTVETPHANDCAIHGPRPARCRRPDGCGHLGHRAGSPLERNLLVACHQRPDEELSRLR